MGVTGLWTVVHPCARPIKVETLNRKRLAVDASIWIYQFLKAVRDKEGNALRNSHVVGFFRRICKLLFIGVRPVFVFDGGAPALKRQTISGRKSRREGRREDAARTASKLLALQMQRRAEEEEQKRKDGQAKGRHVEVEEEETLPEDLVYAEEVNMAPQERQQNRKFKRKDAYHLPDLDVSLAEMGQPNDPRIMSLEELQHYARQFDTGEDINVYDFSKIDFDSSFFVSLPASDRYNILSAARLRSRLRMGYSKDQLDTMFPDRMAFSKFQIERVRERNELTQRLMNINGMNDDSMWGVNGTSRVAGEKGLEYILVKNDNVEGGWALGVVSNDKDAGKREKPIDVEALEKSDQDEEDEDWEEEELEDVPIEGLNRLPKRTQAKPSGSSAADVIAQDLERRRHLYKARKQGVPRIRRGRKYDRDDPDSLFIAETSELEEEWEDVNLTETANGDANEEPEMDEDEELQRATAMSLEHDHATGDVDENEDYEEVFQQSKAEETRPFSKGSGLAIARMANARSNKVAVGPFEEDEDEDEASLHAVLTEPRRAKHKPRRPPSPPREPTASKLVPVNSASESHFAAPNPFGGPLPFEKLDLGSSLLGKKKMQKLTDDASGGFIKDTGERRKKGEPVPPWFEGNPEEDLYKQKIEDDASRKRDEEIENDYEFEVPPRLRKHDTQEVIDLETTDAKSNQNEVIDLSAENVEQPQQRSESPDVTIVDPEVRMGNMADKVRAEPPPPPLVSPARIEVANQGSSRGATLASDAELDDEGDELLPWEASDHEDIVDKVKPPVPTDPAGGKIVRISKSPSPESEGEEFEDVAIEMPARPVQKTPSPVTVPDDEKELLPPPSMSGVATQEVPLDYYMEEGDVGHDYSDPEDEDLFRQLVQEQEEHARFASGFNQRSVEQNIADYERELKQLRNQQKKDRRDADEVTQTMITECKQLLTLFGLPYITAPMEAEAQCAELVRLGLVDGIVTDDSDCFLFGGTRVYKNMFNQAKFVECYLTSDLEAEFGLTRQRLIAIAQLLGSDYTEGLPGIGPVTALEILSEFDNLAAFKEWWDSVQTTARPKSADASSKFRTKFRKSQATKLFLPPSFPDPRVDIAYIKPDVDSDPSQFVWGVPDLNALRSFLMSTIGWSPERTDEILVPVIRDMNRREQEGTQSNITRFFEGGVGAGAFAPRRRAAEGSKRLESALQKIGARARGETAADGMETVEAHEEPAGGGTAANKANNKPRAAKRRRAQAEASDESGDDDEASVESRKRSRGRNKKPQRRKKSADVA
jgi:DNA excision repair protein ERCC-5